MATKKEFFQFRINKIKIKDNKEGGKAEVKLVSFVTTNDVNIPVIDGIFQTTDEVKQKEIIKKATQSVLSSKVLNVIENVTDNHVAPFGKTGFALYTGEKIPLYFNWSLIAVEVDGDIRNAGKVIDGIINKPEFDTFANELIPELFALSSVATAPYVAGAKIVKFVANTVASVLKNNKDDQLGLYYVTFNRFEHYPYGIKNDDDVIDLTRNLKVDYSIFGTEYFE